MVQAATSYDVLINHETYVTDGSASGQSGDNGPVGGAFTYRAKVKINGQTGSLANVQLTEKLPLSSIFQGVSVTGGITCNAPVVGTEIKAENANIVCVLPSISAASFTQVDFKVILPTESNGWTAYASTAPVVGNTDDDSGNNNNIDRNITTFPRADLTVAITAPVGGSTVTQGDVVNYKVQVSNADSTYANPLLPGEKAVLRFNQPQGTSFQGGVPPVTGWTCQAKVDSSTSPATNYQECTYTVPAGAGIAKGASLPVLTFPVTVNVGSGQVPAQASVVGQLSSGTAFTEAVWDNNTADNQVNVKPNLNMDMALTKSVDIQTLDADAGADVPVVYTIKAYRVSGQLNPADITVTDTLPAGVSFSGLDASSSNWSCDAQGQVITCTFGGSKALGNGNPAYVEDLKIKATVAQSALISGAELKNRADLTVSNETVPNGSNNHAEATSSVKDSVNLTINKSASVGVVASGQKYAYNIVVTNKGPLDVRNGQTITITDPLDNRLEFLGADLPWSCSRSGGASVGSPAVVLGELLSCTYSGGIANGGSSTLKLNVKPHLSGSQFARITNEATLAGVSGRDPVTQISNKPSINISELQADLSIIKTATKTDGTSNYGNGASGSEVVYQLTVKNDNSSVKPSDGDMQMAQTVEITDTVNNLINTARAEVAGVPVYAANNRYLTADVKLPAGSTVTSDPCTLSGANTNTSSNVKCVLRNVPVGTDEYVVTIRARQYVDPKDSTQSGQTNSIKNTAKVSSPDTAEYDTKNNESSASVALTALSDVTVTKVANPAQAAAGQDIGYTLTAINKGPSAARVVTVEDVLPVGAIWVSKPEISGGSCTLGDGATQTTEIAIGSAVAAPNNHLVCTWTAALALNGQFVAKYHLRSVTKNPPAKLDNAVYVSTITPETSKLNNNAEATVTLGASKVDVLVNMKHTDDGIALDTGSTQYTITVTNNAASDSYATGVKMTEDFFTSGSGAKFAFISLDSITSSDSTHVFDLATTCTVPAAGATTGQLVCNFPWLKPGEAVDINFTMKPSEILNGKATGTIYHSASVSADVEQLPSADVNANNRTTDRTSTYDPVQVSDPSTLKYIDLSIQKEAIGIPAEGVKVGDIITYNLVVKNEEDPAVTPPLNLVNGRAEVKDTLPLGLKAVDVPQGCDYDAMSRTVSCLIVNLNAGASITYTLSAEVTQLSSGQTEISNTAEVTSLGDPEESNNRSTVNVPTKDVSFDLELHKSVDKAEARAGETLTYTLEVVNLGPAQSQAGQISDPLPDGLVFVASAEGCIASGATVSCAVDELDKDVRKTFTFTAKVANTVTGPQTLVNTATVTADGDKFPENNQSTAETKVPSLQPETPTPTPTPTPVPTLTQWGYLLMMGLMAVLGLMVLRRRSD